MLAAQRFNRFQLSLGIGYDSLQGVRDAYLLFAYPFLLAMPGYSVRAVNLADQARERNLAMLHRARRRSRKRCASTPGLVASGRSSRSMPTASTCLTSPPSREASLQCPT